MMNYLVKCNRIRFKIINFITMVLLVTACSPIQKSGPNISAEINLPVKTYLSKAANAEGSKQIDWQILALRAMVMQGDITQASQLYSKLTLTPINNAQQYELILVDASLQIKKNNLNKALTILKTTNWQQANNIVYANQLKLKAQVYNKKQLFLKKAAALTDLDKYLEPAQRSKNWQDVWDSINKLSNAQLRMAFFDQPKGILKGWLELADIYKNNQYRTARLREQLNLFLKNNLTHPANRYLPKQLQNFNGNLDFKPKHIGLVLPLTGQLQRQSEVIKKGFIDALMQDPLVDSSTELRLYNSNSSSMDMVYQSILRDGIELVVGPLLKAKVLETIQANDAQLPVLALNTPDAMQVGSTNVCFYSLSPEGEARQAATHINNKGYKHPIVFAAQNNLNTRMANEFVLKWSELNPEQEAIKVIQVADMGAISAQLEELFTDSEYDAIYLLGTSDEVAIIKPFVDVVANPEATNIKYFASSRINTKDLTPELLVELKGIEFSEMPYILEQQKINLAESAPAVPAVIATSEDESSSKDTSIANNILANELQVDTRLSDRLSDDFPISLSRLYAMGADAYNLSKLIIKMQSNQEVLYSGNTGLLSNDQNCIIHREMTWAEFTLKGVKSLAIAKDKISSTVEENTTSQTQPLTE